jgi:hypothetical protein
VKTDREVSILKVHRQCPLVLLVKKTEGKPFGSNEVKVMGCGLFCDYAAEKKQ